ncbi:MAG: hypothetical protein OXD44_08670 [Gammaproteobacteria bacterium]|nr:hypothetical protein [Gammaproteobacteria bacterium]MCY4313748.1 hypothetical protein [Gammaproteobacteria bacterium]
MKTAFAKIDKSDPGLWTCWATCVGLKVLVCRDAESGCDWYTRDPVDMDHGTTCREMRRSASAMIREWQADRH